jgi:hypothetical protein
MLLLLLLLLLFSSVLSFNNNIKHWNRSKGFVLNPTLLVQSSEKFNDKSKQTAFLKECSKTIANILGKPEQYVMISYKHVDGMIYAGNDECKIVSNNNIKVKDIRNFILAMKS